MHFSKSASSKIIPAFFPPSYEKNNIRVKISNSSEVFIVNFEHILHLFLVFLLLTLNKWTLAGILLKNRSIKDKINLTPVNQYPVGIYLFKFNNRNTTTMCENIIQVSVLVHWTSKRRLSKLNDYFEHWLSHKFPGNEKKDRKATTVLHPFKGNALNT